MTTDSTVIRLVGGSNHGKKIQVRGTPPYVFMMKRQKRKKWMPDFLINYDDSYVIIEQEKYDRQYIRNIQATSPGRWLVETKVIYLKKGSSVKQETMWKLGMPYETRIQDYAGTIIY